MSFEYYGSFTSTLSFCADWESEQNFQVQNLLIINVSYPILYN